MSLVRTGACALILAAAGLASCGKVGPLERPGPLFGHERNTSAAAAERTAAGQDPSRPVDTVDPRDRTTDPAPPRTLPIGGQGQDPARTAPQGALPDPYASPRR